MADIFFLMVPIASLIFWFFTAPDIRFAGASMWLLGGGVTVLSALRCRASTQILVSTIFLLLLSLVFGTSALYRGLWVPPGPDHGFHPIPAVDTYEFVTTSGLIVNVPETGDQCWDVPLPCTPYPDPNLRLLDGEHITSGFAAKRR